MWVLLKKIGNHILKLIEGTEDLCHHYMPRDYCNYISDNYFSSHISQKCIEGMHKQINDNVENSLYVWGKNVWTAFIVDQS